MTVHQLKLFLAVCKYGSILSASEYMHISQPSISVAIKQLEKEFNITLFHRIKQRLVLTEDGLLFQEGANDVVNSFDLFESRMMRLESRESKICLGISAMPSVFLYPNLINDFSQENPHISIELREQSSPTSAKQVCERQLDMAIVVHDDSFSDQLDFVPIMKTNIVGCVRKDHVLANQLNVTPNMLENESLVFSGENSNTTDYLLSWFRQADVAPKIVMHTHQVQLMMQLVEHCNAVAFMMDGLLRINSNVAPVHITPSLEYSIGVIKKKHVPLSPASEKFLHFCNQYKFQ